jgi:hypothetical protein
MHLPQVQQQVWLINVYGDTTYSSNVTLGDATTDKRMLVVKYSGDLTINSGVTVTVNTVSALTYKKGLFLYVAGNLINNGTITMTARGTYNQSGENVYLWKNANATYEYIPAVGGLGGVAVTLKNANSVHKNGTNGTNGLSRSTGGGGSGGVFNNVEGTAVSGAGGAGTSYSGGAGGGAMTSRLSTYYGYDGSSIGGAGGAGRSSKYSNSGGYSAGGGAGNPGGIGSGVSCCEYNSGQNGTGGLLIIRANNVTNGGTISSRGSNGGYATGASGGSSGGGSINIFTYGSYTSTGTVIATGGDAMTYGSLGGNGSISIGSIATGNFVSQ